MKLFRGLGKKSSIVDVVQHDMDKANEITSAQWYKDAFNNASKKDLEWDAVQAKSDNEALFDNLSWDALENIADNPTNRSTNNAFRFHS